MNLILSSRGLVHHSPGWLLLLSCLPFIGQLGLQAGASERQPLFESKTPLALRIEAPIAALIEQKYEDPEWLTGRLLLTGGSGAEKAFDIELKARGHSRRMSDWCNFPPFWINLKKSQLPGTLWENQNKLKVVVHCQERKDAYQKYLYREYLVYQTYNLITDASFRVRLANIEYVETAGRRKPVTRSAFLLEHDSNLADRLECHLFEGPAVLPRFYDPAALTRVELFQFLIGNTDQSLFAGGEECCHNARALIPKKSADGYIPVPYDFDLSGLVNAPYAQTHASLNLSSVRQRLYRGIRCPPEILAATIGLYQEKREAILNLWRHTELLEERDRRESVAYLEEFFAIIGDPAAVKKHITDQMLNPEGVTNSLKKSHPEAFKDPP